MSWDLTSLVTKRVIGGQSRKLLMLTMADKANDDGSGVYASFATLADACEMNRATVKRIVKEFEDEGLIVKVGERPCSNGKTNDYTLVVSALDALPKIEKRTGGNRNPVRETPGVLAEPGASRPLTRCVAPPKPIQNQAATAAASGARELNPAEVIVATINSPWLDPAKSPDLGQTQTEVARWIAAGADLHLDCIPVISAILARERKTITRWGYFTRAVREHVARRIAPIEIIQPEPANGRPATNFGARQRTVSLTDAFTDLTHLYEDAAARRGPGVA